MGWKNVKDHYRIEHIVQVVESGNICIGSGYIHNIMEIDVDGVLKKRSGRSISNKDLSRYRSEMEANPGLLRELVLSPDSFTSSITVYTYDEGEVLEKKCEVFGWPNVTHDGCVMYENTFYTDKNEVIRWAREDLDSAIKSHGDRLQELEKELEKKRQVLSDYVSKRARLEEKYHVLIEV